MDFTNVVYTARLTNSECHAFHLRTGQKAFMNSFMNFVNALCMMSTTLVCFYENWFCSKCFYLFLWAFIRNFPKKRVFKGIVCEIFYVFYSCVICNVKCAHRVDNRSLPCKQINWSWWLLFVNFWRLLTTNWWISR